MYTNADELLLYQAVAQFTGYKARQNGDSLLSLASCMNLKAHEFKLITDKFPRLLTRNEIIELKDYLYENEKHE